MQQPKSLSRLWTFCFRHHSLLRCRGLCAGRHSPSLVLLDYFRLCPPVFGRSRHPVYELIKKDPTSFSSWSTGSWRSRQSGWCHGIYNRQIRHTLSATVRETNAGFYAKSLIFCYIQVICRFNWFFQFFATWPILKRNFSSFSEPRLPKLSFLKWLPK